MGDAALAIPGFPGLQKEYDKIVAPLSPEVPEAPEYEAPPTLKGPQTVKRRKRRRRTTDPLRALGTVLTGPGGALVSEDIMGGNVLLGE